MSAPWLNRPAALAAAACSRNAAAGNRCGAHTARHVRERTAQRPVGRADSPSSRLSSSGLILPSALAWPITAKTSEGAARSHLGRRIRPTSANSAASRAGWRSRHRRALPQRAAAQRARTMIDQQTHEAGHRLRKNSPMSRRSLLHRVPRADKTTPTALEPRPTAGADTAHGPCAAQPHADPRKRVGVVEIDAEDERAAGRLTTPIRPVVADTPTLATAQKSAKISRDAAFENASTPLVRRPPCCCILSRPAAGS